MRRAGDRAIFGSKADIALRPRRCPPYPQQTDIAEHDADVRFVAKSGLMHCSNQPRAYDKYCLIFGSSWRGLKGFGTQSSQPAAQAFLSSPLSA
jgi:hypothetical protein